jgi:peroxiredoxin
VTGIDVGQLAPDFELPTPEGELVRLSDYRGRPVWINFWAPWCPACRTEMPRLEGFYLDHQSDDLVVLGVGVRDSADAMRTYASEVGVSYPIVVDGDGAVANEYQALALPVHYWIDRDGVVRDWAFGELPPDLLATSLATILAPPSGPAP